MGKQRWWLVGLGALLLAGTPALWADAPDPVNDAQALADKIDQQLATRWLAEGVAAARPADDAEFLRRVYLDLAGRIPSVAETRAFLDDKAANKRQRLIERLLASPRYVSHFTNVWRSLMLPEISNGASVQTRFLAPAFEGWLRKELTKNAGYDEMARELLTAPVSAQNGRGFGLSGDAGPSSYYLAKELKPENVAASTSRLFLGVRLECAQCHNHPFASWKREQFWSYAAFFAGLEAQRQGDFVAPGQERPDRREIAIPGTERVVQAKFLDGSEPLWRSRESTRTTLADWLTSPDNPYFARATVNRLWAYFFGIGLIDPVDEMVGAEHVASHPELLDELARQFVAHKYDLKFLIRALVLSRAYQLSSIPASKGEDNPQLFTHMPIRGLAPEQLFDSLVEATGFQEGGPAGNVRIVGFGNNTPRTEFLTKFAGQNDRATEVQTSILQALALMNGRFTADATSLERSETLAAVLDAPFLDTRARIETLYLAALARKPRPHELSRITAYVESSVGNGTDQDRRMKQALADVFWALLNSSEFFLNH